MDLEKGEEGRKGVGGGEEGILKRGKGTKGDEFEKKRGLRHRKIRVVEERGGRGVGREEWEGRGGERRGGKG